MTFAHVAGVPVEETLAMFGPAALAAFGAVVARLRASRPRRAARRSRATPADGEAPDPRRNAPGAA
jgi:hypothetical protein